METMMKLLIKIVEPSPDSDAIKYKWIHFCYVPEELCKAYKEEYSEDFTNFNATLARWAKADFDKELSVEKAEDIDTLRGLIKDYCKQVYPDIYLEQATDRQGWLRVWVTKKMKEELELGE